RIDGALRARELHAAGGYHFDLAVGEEITTRRGHLLALFVEERIPALRPLAETVERIHAAGGIAVAPHSLAPLTPSLGAGSSSRLACTGARGTTWMCTGASWWPRRATWVTRSHAVGSGAERRYSALMPRPGRSSASLKIALVSPYGYPHPGGVNDHVRNQYEELRRLGHDAWIITSKYGKERESEGHIIRLGTGWAFPANGSMGRVTLGWRFKEQARELLAEHRFDILHFHEPFVPFLSPTVLDQSDTASVVNVATFHAF